MIQQFPILQSLYLAITIPNQIRDDRDEKSPLESQRQYEKFHASNRLNDSREEKIRELSRGCLHFAKKKSRRA